MPKSVLGINLGNHSVKVVELTRRGNSFVVQNLLSAPTKEAIVSGEIIQPDVVALMLKDLLRTAGVRTKEAVVAVGGQSGVVVRVTELPKMPRKELMKAIPLEIERHLPFQSSGVVQDYALLKEPEEVAEGGQIPILFAAARADLVDAYMLAIQQAGLSPIAVEVEPLATARAFFAARGFGLTDGQPGRVFVLVNIGYEGTEISFVEGGAVIFTRFVPVGGRHLTEDLRDHLRMDLEEAERVKIEQATAWIEKPTAPAPEVQMGAETQVLPTATQQVPSVATPPPPTEELPSLSIEPPTEEQPSEQTISFELPTEPVAKPEEKEEEEKKEIPPPSLEFSLPLPEEQPPTPTQEEPSLEFVPGQPTGELSVQTPPAPAPEEWVPSPPLAQPPPIQELIFNAISPHLYELAGEIARSVEFLISQRSEVVVDEVYLLGGGALLKDLDKFLQNQLGVPVVRLNPFRHMDISPVTSKMKLERVEQVAPVYAVAVGLALWAYL
ncbi:MAG: type IV pilus assembly protein PilM [Candidatus Fervidibacter sp.]|uniref:type IV pilus assembly protein PilM n=1 Tax=Candidatus Fervidibacter sp. TaxID=3100871 RepID=UPI004049AD08